MVPVLSVYPDAPYPGFEVVSFQEALDEVLPVEFDCVQVEGTLLNVSVNTCAVSVLKENSKPSKKR